eukprot:TRINITY_DN7635_c0_g1_i1.p1 TRINITY_DN7635_c0_g1~~TRINITY_DN7635_c0_g1_i1.p1  ORF type:complete len:434 (+),score=94.65 TRINITY_DN7635_c0_g1_i1:37-1302(+)
MADVVPATEAEKPKDVVVEEIDSDIEFVSAPTFSVDVRDELKDEEVRPDDLDDNERIPKESESWPSLFPPANANQQMRQETESAAALAMQAGDFTGAINVYTEAMRANGSNPHMLCTRAALLLKQKRPCAAIRDCTAAMKINNQLVKAHRIRGMAHRKLGHWKKAHRDLSEAQNLKFDTEIADMHKLVAGKVGVNLGTSTSTASSRKRRSSEADSPPKRPVRMDIPDPIIPEMHFPAPVAAPDPPLDKGQAVVIVGLQRAPHLNGRRGVVEREDPRPASKGRWEVEVRMDGGVLEIKSLKRENIQTLNKVDREACKAWAKAEKLHKEAREKRELQEESNKYKKVVEAKMTKIALSDRAKDLVRTLGPEQALSVLDRCEGPGVTNVSGFVITQAKLLLGQDDSDSDEGEANGTPGKKAKSGA